jgi:uncharacterized membrane protein
MKEFKTNPLSNFSTFRLETLEDSVFAIAMTLLVLNLKVPSQLDNSLLQAIFQIWPHLVTYFGSFVLLGVFWFGHRSALHFIKHADHVFHWLNIILLMFVSIVPFSASLISKYYNEQAAVIIYGINLVSIGLTMTIQWYYATNNFKLVDPQLPLPVIKFAKLRLLFSPFAYFTAIILSFADIKISLIIYTVVPILYIVPVFLPIWRYCAKSRFI